MAKSVLITGTSEGGIGDALAQEFQARGLRVFATARNLAKVEHLRAKGMDVLALDVTSAASIKAAVDAVQIATGGKLDFLVNNSGAGYYMPLIDSDINAVKDMFDVNVFSLVTVTQAFSPLIIAAKGKVINIGSINSRAPLPFMSMYSATKAAVTIMSDTLRIELAPFGVQVINVVTGAIVTKFFDNMPKVELPADSIYQPISDEFQKNSVRIPDGAMTAEKFAKGAVANALKAKPNPYFWFGGNATTIWLVSNLLPHTFGDSIFAKFGSLEVLTKRLSAMKA